MLPEARITHRTARRMRVRIPSRKRDESYFSSLREHFSRCEGIEHVETDALTGSVLLVHRTGVNSLAESLKTNDFFILRKDLAPVTPLYRKAVQPFSDLDRGLKKFTGGEIDLPSAVFVGLLGVGIYQISVGNFVAPAWYTAFWYALNTVFKAQSSARE